MKRLLPSLAIATLALIPFAAKADIAPEPGFHYWSSCVFIDNAADFPEYNFYVRHTGKYVDTAVAARAPQACDTTEQVRETGIIAVKKADESKIKHENNEFGSDVWADLEQNGAYLKGVNLKDPNHLITLPESASIPNKNPSSRFSQTYHLIPEKDGHVGYAVDATITDGEGKVISRTAVSLPIDQQIAEQRNISALATLLLGVIAGAGMVILMLAGKTWKK